MAEKEKIDRGHYSYDGYDIIKDTDRTGNPWEIFKNYQQVTEVKVTEKQRLKDCIEFLDDYEEPNFDAEEQKIDTTKGSPVFVVTDDFLDQMEDMDDPEYQESKALFKEIVKDEQHRVRIIFLALIRRKIKKLEQMDMLTTRVEELVEANIDRYSPEQLIEFYEVISKRLNQESEEIGKIVNSL